MILRGSILFLFTLAIPLVVNAQTLDMLYEYGNAADANDFSGAGIPRGADFSDAASGNYTITAGGTDFWSGTDHGSAIFGPDNEPVTGNFSAVVKVQVGLEGEVMPGEWGRSGIMARTDPADPQSAYFASTQKFRWRTRCKQSSPTHSSGARFAGSRHWSPIEWFANDSRDGAGCS